MPAAPVRARKRWWIAGSFWTPKRDEQLRRLRDDGLSAAKIAEKLGTTRSAVIGRLHRLTGALYTFPSYIRQAKEARARSAVRIKERARLQRAAIARMQQEVARGVERDQAIARARQGGATLRAIGDVFGITRERVRQIVVDRSTSGKRDS